MLAMRIGMMVAAAFMIPVFAASSQATESLNKPLAASSCAFGAFVSDTDPAGLNVRDMPSASGKIIGKLPPPKATADMPDYAWKTEVTVVGFKDGWFNITRANVNSIANDNKPAKAIFIGSGWVHGGKLTIKSQADKGYASPDTTSPVTLQFSRNDAESESGIFSEPFDGLVDASALIACMGEWALIELSMDKLHPDFIPLMKATPTATAGLPKGKVRAWVNRLCAIQETSCN